MEKRAILLYCTPVPGYAQEIMMAEASIFALDINV